MNKFTKLAMMLTMAASLSMAGAASAHWHQPLSWTHRDYGHGDWYGHDHGHGHGDDHHHHGDCGCGGGLFSLFTRRVVIHHYYPPPPPVYCAPSLYPRPTAGREEPKEVVMEEEWDGKDKKHSAHRRRPISGSGGAGSTD